jgi:hypothetical protein
MVQQFARGQPGEQAENQLTDSTSRLDPTEPVRDPSHQLIKPSHPPVRVYARPAATARSF